MSTSRSDAERMWNSTFALTASVGLAEVVAIAATIDRTPKMVSTWTGLAALLMISLSVLLWLRKRPSTAVCPAVFVFQVATIMTAVYLLHRQYVLAGRAFEPFAALKLLALVVGIVAPPRLWVGIVSLAAAAVFTVVRYASWPASVREGLPVQEPWMTLMWVAVAAVLYGFRLRAIALDRRLAQAEGERVALRRMAELLLSARDLAGTPLQTLETTIALLAARHPEAVSEIQRMRHSVERLGRLTRLFSDSGSRGPWQPDPKLLDIELLERAMARQTAQAKGLEGREDSDDAEEAVHADAATSAPKFG